MTATAADPIPQVNQDRIAFYREHGFVHIPEIITKAEAARFHAAALAMQAKLASLDDNEVFTQMVNVWRQDDTMRELTLHPSIAAAAQRLAGVDLRLWHDHTLIKQPRKSKPTEFHQDQPYWPHAGSPSPLSAWVALCDVPVERGCMTFLPGSHDHTDLSAQNLRDERSLFDMASDLQWSPRVTVPLRAGDCTFHHGRCAHMATPNFTDDPRVAHVMIFIDRDTTYTGTHHVVTDPMGLEAGVMLEGELFPTCASIIADG